MHKYQLYLLFCLLFWIILPSVAAQVPEMISPVVATLGTERLESYDQRIENASQSLLSNVKLKNIGPTVMSGRIVDIDANPDNPVEIYVAYATGGLWHSKTNGISFEPLFDNQASIVIGDIAVDWANGHTIWVGTGENNSSRSSYAGTGIYRSTDQGKSWEHLGLENTHRIGRILIHPNNPEIVWVAALGALYSSSPDRGIYMTTDGGQSWLKTLYVSENAGVIDLIIDPTDPQILYATSWHRERRAWNFVEGGNDSNIWKSSDGGLSWTQLASEGFPIGDSVGRIGLDISPKNPDILYALVDNQSRRADEDDDDEPILTRDALRSMSATEFLTLDEDSIDEYLKENNFEDNYTVDVIRSMVGEGSLEPKHLVWYVEDANRELFDTPVVGAEVYRSDDGGNSWTKTHQNYLDRVYFSYGYYFGEIRVDATDPERIYILGVPLLTSDDGGSSWQSIGGPNVHVDHQALWVNPHRSGHLINGNDGGINITYDNGQSWFKGNTPPVGQFYAIGVDDQKPYHVYGGLQDNGVWGGPHTYTASTRWHAYGNYPYSPYLGGDGMQVEVDTRTNDIIYTGSQFGAYRRIEIASGKSKSIRPRHDLGERPLRYNWQTPIHLSRHNQDVLYYGSNKLHRSFNRGEDWETLSEDLTRGGRRGDVPYGTLTTIDESPLRFGLVYVGSDDGLIHVSKDGGYTWENISDEDWGELWVSRVEASSHVLGRVYVTLNGYRWDHFNPYVFKSDDFGQSWEPLHGSLPMEPVNVILEDPINESLLYVGTDNGLFVSIDGGSTFLAMQNGLPHVPVHDLKLQHRRKHLLVGTHGRSIFRADIASLQNLTPKIIESTITAFPPDAITYNPNWGNRPVWWQEHLVPDFHIPYWSGLTGLVSINIKDKDNNILNNLTDEAEKGLNYLRYDLAVNDEGAKNLYTEGDEQINPGDNGQFYLPSGEYFIEFQIGEETFSVPFRIKAPEN